MLGLPQYLWRLLPANPILLRVVESGGKRTRDLIIRCIYLGILVLLVLFSLGNVETGDIAKLSFQSTAIFNQLSVLQLILVALLAPIFTAGAITQEKDSQTYDILLATPLTNGQIVFGSLFSRLFFVFALLLSGIPIFSITQVFGGVAIADIVMSVLIAAATALVTGALAIAIATFKIGTRRTIFSFYLFNVLYLVGLMLIDRLDGVRLPLDAAVSLPADAKVISWVTPFHPFLALNTVLDPVHYVTPTLSQLSAALRTWPLGWMYTHPAGFYVTLQTVLSFVLVLPSTLLLRKMAQSTSSIASWFLKFLPIAAKDKARKPRTVWSNPIAWREAKTKASAARSVLVRYGFILLGLAGAIVLLVGFSTEKATPPRYVDGGYSAASSTVFIRGQGTGNYLIDERTRITLDGNEVPPEILNGRYAVENVGRALKNKSQYFNMIALRTIPRAISADDVRRFLLGMVLVEVTAILLIITNAAASTVTREKEDGTLDLLLATPITSRYYIWGKLRGLISYVMPLLAVPVMSCAVFVVYDIFRMLRTHEAAFEWLVLPESVVLMPGMLIVVFAFAGLVGMHMSLRCRTTVWAVMSSVAIMLGVTGILGWCGYAILSTNRQFADFYVAIGSFSPVTMIMLLIAPKTAILDPAVGANLAGSTRVLMLVFSLVAIGAYAAVVWTMYVSMVKNFDMTIRKQSR